MSLWMLWATPGYWEGRRMGVTPLGRPGAQPTPAPPPLSPGSSRPPPSRPSARPGAPARLRRQQRAPPPERPPWPATPCRAPLPELSGESGHDNRHHGFTQPGSRSVLSALRVNNPTHRTWGPGPSSWPLPHFTDEETEAQREIS